MHPKKQELMVEKFLEMKPKGWELILIGGVTGSQSLKSVEELRKKVGRGDNIKIITDASFERLKEYYSKAKIFWHAAGFGEDLKNHPERGEHFGMTTVEAMAAGCVPVCFAGGGQTEIIDNGLNGYLWRDVDGLREATIRLITEDKLRRKMLVEAIGKSAQFSVKRFYLALEAIV
jgi:glycosyltransferase involved in cell wall biosynthesis